MEKSEAAALIRQAADLGVTFLIRLKYMVHLQMKNY